MKIVIDKEAEIIKLENMLENLTDAKDRQSVRFAINLISGFKETPKERPQGERWIPVSERLPEGKIDPMTNDFELVLCSTVIGVVRPYTFGKPIGHAKAHFWSGRYAVDDYVIAWMPLPEPYKEAEND